MTILLWATVRVQRFLCGLVLRSEQWLLAHEAMQSDPLVLAGAIPSPACRALEYDAYMRNNRSATSLPLESTVATHGRRIISER